MKFMTEHPFCWGAIMTLPDDRNGEPVGQCDKCGTHFYTSETNVDGADVQVLREFGPDDPCEDE